MKEYTMENNKRKVDEVFTDENTDYFPGGRRPKRMKKYNLDDLIKVFDELVASMNTVDHSEAKPIKRKYLTPIMEEESGVGSRLSSSASRASTVILPGPNNKADRKPKVVYYYMGSKRSCKLQCDRLKEQANQIGDEDLHQSIAPSALVSMALAREVPPLDCLKTGQPAFVPCPPTTPAPASRSRIPRVVRIKPEVEATLIPHPPLRGAPSRRIRRPVVPARQQVQTLSRYAVVPAITSSLSTRVESRGLMPRCYRVLPPIGGERK